MRSIPMDYEGPPVSKKPRKWPTITPEMHVKIKSLYMNRVDCSGEIAEFADRYGLPRWKISRYAQDNGWLAKGKREPAWTDAELDVLKRNAHHSPIVIQKRLKAHGYTRSCTGIVLKRKRMRFLQNLPGQSATGLAMCLGEDNHFVLRAIRSGQLKAVKRELERTEQQGGNPWLIRDKDAREFIMDNLHMIDLRKVDKYWFVDLLVNPEN